MAKPRTGARKATSAAKKVRTAKAARKRAARRVARAKASKRAARATRSAGTKRPVRKVARARQTSKVRRKAGKSRVETAKAKKRAKARSEKARASQRARSRKPDKAKARRALAADKARARKAKLEKAKAAKAAKKAREEKARAAKEAKKAKAEKAKEAKRAREEKARAAKEAKKAKAEKAKAAQLAREEKAKAAQLAREEKAKAAEKARQEKALAAQKETEAKALSAERIKAAHKAQLERAQAAGKGGRGRAVSPPVVVPQVEKPRPRATKLPPQGAPLNKRDMEQLLTAGQGRGVVGEGSLKGRLVAIDGMPYLVVVGRDKRELNFLLQGPDQEVLPAYVDHKVSVSGLIRKTTYHGGTVDVRKFSAKKPEEEVPEPTPVETEPRLRFLSPGDVSQVMSPGMGAGMKGFAPLRGHLEMTGEEFILVVSNAGTRQQVSFILEGKGTGDLRKHLGQTLLVTGVVDKGSGWGGRIAVETVELRPAESRPLSREGMELAVLEGEQAASVDVKLNHGLIVRLREQPGATWAIEPTVAKRVGLREVNFEPGQEGGPARREFFFIPRNPGGHEVEFFLAKAFNPGQVERSFKVHVTVKP